MKAKYGHVEGCRNLYVVFILLKAAQSDERQSNWALDTPLAAVFNDTNQLI